MASYNFTVNGEYECTLHLFKQGRDYTKILIKEQAIILMFKDLVEFKKNNFSTTVVGVKLMGDNKQEEVVAEMIPSGLIMIGCMPMTQTDFNKFFNLIKFKQNEFFRHSSN